MRSTADPGFATRTNTCPVAAIYSLTLINTQEIYLTAGKVSKYGVFSGPHFHIFGLNTGKYGPEKKTYLDSFHTVPVNPKAH